MDAQIQAIAERFRTARKLAGVTQKDAALALDVTERTYARWEKGDTAGFLPFLARIAEVVGTSEEELRGPDAGVAEEGRLAEVERQLRHLTELVEDVRGLMVDPERLRAEADALIASEAPKRKSRPRRKPA
jgi:transcriptional regulator with XRE-family HTH domain